MAMSIRLQVLLDSEELAEVREHAEKEHMTVSAWVRRAIRHEISERPAARVHEKLAAISRAQQYRYPSGDFGNMAAEIEHDYSAGIEP
ncbi:MAG: ribbon-helix-helix protein, CopG family [Spirochaetaceae bacterium]|nr:MAG: ribbon-helix-helix protein, CopG family [Spirochaetaceae bacterium]